MIFPYEYRVLWEVAARGPSRRDVMWMGSGRLPSSAILALLGTLRSLRHTQRVARDAARLYRLGRAAAPLVLFPWEDHWATPLADVRRMLNLPVAPEPIGGYTAEILAAA